jgi:hypothetical protein
MRARTYAVVVVLAAAGCGIDDPGLALVDAAAPIDAAGGPAADADRADDPDPLSWVDFAIIGCGGDTLPGEVPCTGVAPLTLGFVALAPAPIEVYRWSFGDGSGQSIASSPIHIFELPGTYDVTLTVGGPGGTARAAIEGAVRVDPAPIGSTCAADLQCETGSCTCAGGDCEPPLAAGLCAAECDAENPCDLGVCADLAAASPEAPAPWQRALCVRACEADSDCPAGRACMELPAGDADDERGWVSGCFAPELLGPIGGPCLGAGGEPRHELCASGLCVVEGARGLCAADCSFDAPCPASAACATFEDAGLGSLCVHRCVAGDGDAACAQDPWLACEPSGGSGPGGFDVDEPPAEAGYCAPRACDGPDACGPDGACIEGYCGPA